MNVLEKILEEIEDHAIEFESFGMCDDYVSVGWAKDIIRSHMGDVPKCRECSRRKFYMQGYEDGKKNDGWIPVEERMPTKEEFLKDDGRFILDDGNRRYQGLFDIYDGKFKFSRHISGIHYELFEDKCVIAWQPLPEPYKEV